MPCGKAQVIYLCLYVYLAYHYGYSFADYVNLDEPSEIYFCSGWNKRCVKPYGQVDCGGKNFCPTSTYAYCVWDTKEWDCFSDMDFGTEIINPSVTCNERPYANWAKIESCTLTYDIAPRTRHTKYEVFRALYGYDIFITVAFFIWFFTT